MLKLSALVFLTVFGVYEASVLYKPIMIDDYDKADEIVTTYLGIYLSHSEFAEKLEAVLTKDQEKLFKQITTRWYQCYIEFIESTVGQRICTEDFMENYEKKKVDKLLHTIRRVKTELPSYMISDLTWKYEKIYDFYVKIIQQLDHRIKLLNEFTEEEKDFMETLVTKRNRWIFHIDNIKAFMDLAKFTTDNETFNNVLDKVKKLENELIKN